ncbi:hypothetical protein HNQ91_002369 [Filimonas zeae]|uniref:DUF3606 domain-containing protein n=1 Tax=Filimonas zeae TaxID=1737353 RepID=A0A917IUR2_9BACT|nr:DUF3606 domain-containing protein [Filimonas zeae]MDR6339318.1 hypothetical protein [Filimonas zeae]GGH64146.1 hypothetical protein GCM10011379_15850 [Filimonas zeae]
MSDNKVNIGKQDRLKVDAKDPGEVEYLHRQFPWFNHQKIKDAIKRAGPFRRNIEKHLAGAGK